MPPYYIIILHGKLPLTDSVYAFWKGETGLRPWARSGAQNVQAAGVSSGARCLLADALGQGGLTAEAGTFLGAILPSSSGFLEADTLQVGWVLRSLWGSEGACAECIACSLLFIAVLGTEPRPFNMLGHFNTRPLTCTPSLCKGFILNLRSTFSSVF